MVARGHAWLHWGGMHGCTRGAVHGCTGGIHGFIQGACMVLFGGCVWFYSVAGMRGFIPGGMCGFIWGACMVLFRGGMCGFFSFSDTMRYGQ